jgi:hypothetical protein
MIGNEKLWQHRVARQARVQETETRSKMDHAGKETPVRKELSHHSMLQDAMPKSQEGWG